jgi:hypothetical protein
MARRKGLGKGKGKGYKNIAPRDPKVHSQSARGIKQPQRVPDNVLNKKASLIIKTIDGLDDFERRMFRQQLDNTKNPEQALEVMINTIEGDATQMSPALREYAEKTGQLKFWEEAHMTDYVSDLLEQGTPLDVAIGMTADAFNEKPKKVRDIFDKWEDYKR